MDGWTELSDVHFTRNITTLAWLIIVSYRYLTIIDIIHDRDSGSYRTHRDEELLCRVLIYAVIDDSELNGVHLSFTCKGHICSELHEISTFWRQTKKMRTLAKCGN